MLDLIHVEGEIVSPFHLVSDVETTVGFWLNFQDYGEDTEALTILNEHLKKK